MKYIQLDFSGNVKALLRHAASLGSSVFGSSKRVLTSTMVMYDVMQIQWRSWTFCKFSSYHPSTFLNVTLRASFTCFQDQFLLKLLYPCQWVGMERESPIMSRCMVHLSYAFPSDHYNDDVVIECLYYLWYHYPNHL